MGLGEPESAGGNFLSAGKKNELTWIFGILQVYRCDHLCGVHQLSAN